MGKYSTKKTYVRLLERNDENLRGLLEHTKTGGLQMSLQIAYVGAFQANVHSMILDGNLKEANRVLSLTKEEYEAELKDDLGGCDSCSKKDLEGLSDLLGDLLKDLEKDLGGK